MNQCAGQFAATQQAQNGVNIRFEERISEVAQLAHGNSLKSAELEADFGTKVKALQEWVCQINLLFGPNGQQLVDYVNGSMSNMQEEVVKLQAASAVLSEQAASLKAEFDGSNGGVEKVARLQNSMEQTLAENGKRITALEQGIRAVVEQAAREA